MNGPTAFSLFSLLKDVGYVEMAVAVANDSVGNGGAAAKSGQTAHAFGSGSNTPSSSSLSATSATPGKTAPPSRGGVSGMISSLWRSATVQQAGAMVKTASKSVIRGLGFADSARNLEDATFNCFVTYVCMRWDEVLDNVLVRLKSSRLASIQRGGGQRVGARSDQAAFDNNGAPLCSGDNFGRRVAQSTRSDIRQQRLSVSSKDEAGSPPSELASPRGGAGSPAAGAGAGRGEVAEPEAKAATGEAAAPAAETTTATMETAVAAIAISESGAESSEPRH